MFKGTNDIGVIGTRHGEKKHECLLNREEMVRSNDLGDYFRIASDNRDLNYSLYFEEGQQKVSTVEDYTSGNTKQLNDEELEEMLLKLEYVRQELENPNVNFGGHA
jgi:UDP-glucose 4-epimerase